MCSRSGACRWNYQPFGRDFRRSSFLVRSHVLLYEPGELTEDEEGEFAGAVSSPSPHSRVVYSKVPGHKAPRDRAVVVFRKPILPATLSGGKQLDPALRRSMTDGSASIFGGGIAAIGSSGGCPPSSVLLAKMRERTAPAPIVVEPSANPRVRPRPQIVAAAMPANREDVASVSKLMVKVLEVLKARKDGYTTASIFAKFQSLGLLETKKHMIEFREALQTVAHCTDSVWTLKDEWKNFKSPKAVGSSKKPKRG